MDIIEMTRQLGHEIQKDDRFVRYWLAKKANDEDEGLQALIGEFNLKRMSINSESSKPEKDEARIKALDDEIQVIYEAVMANPHMQEYNASKKAFDTILRRINAIVMMSANGDNPDTVELSSCSSGCDGCSGCN